MLAAGPWRIGIDMNEVAVGSLKSFTPAHDVEEDAYRRFDGRHYVGEMFP